MTESLLTVRDFLEPRWMKFKVDHKLDTSRSAPFGMCRLAAGFLGRYLDQPTMFRSGSPAWREKASGTKSGFYGPGGFLAPSGFVPENEFIRDRWNHHSWCEINGLVVDLTVDQFDQDLPRVFVGEADDRYVANCTTMERQAAWLGGAFTVDVQLWLDDAQRELPSPGTILAELADHAPTRAPGYR